MCIDDHSESSHKLVEVELSVVVGISSVEHLLELIPGLLWEWLEAVLLSESLDGSFSFSLGDGLITGRQLIDNPCLDLLLLFFGQVLPFDLALLVSESIYVVVGKSEGSSGSDEGDKGEEFHL